MTRKPDNTEVRWWSISVSVEATEEEAQILMDDMVDVACGNSVKLVLIESAAEDEHECRNFAVSMKPIDDLGSDEE